MNKIIKHVHTHARTCTHTHTHTQNWVCNYRRKDFMTLTYITSMFWLSTCGQLAERTFVDTIYTHITLKHALIWSTLCSCDIRDSTTVYKLNHKHKNCPRHCTQSEIRYLLVRVQLHPKMTVSVQTCVRSPRKTALDRP